MKIAAVVVTYNRRKLLGEVLEAFDSQTVPPEYVIVVDNASTDGTQNDLVDWKKRKIDNVTKIVIRTEKNLGGSGGFYIGVQKAMDLDADWIWVSDDDAVPELNVFEKAKEHLYLIADKENISAICTTVKTNGIIAESNRHYRKITHFKVKIENIPKEKYINNVFECNSFSYIGVIISKIKLQEVGLINKDYFIWRDDVEHSWRLSLVGKILCYSDMIVDHKIKNEDYIGVSWKTYYAYRNDILMLKKHCKRRYWIYKEIVTMLHGIFAKTKIERELFFDAVKAGNSAEKGVSKKYMPGKDIV